jgi:hypothetical protein
MRKIIFSFLFFSALGFSQVNEKENLKKTESAASNTGEEKPDGWVKVGNFSIIGNQSTFNNWLAGGQNNIAANLLINYDFNYKKGNINWDNKVIIGYGLAKIKNANAQKTDDRLLYNSIVGKKASGYWFYSAFFNFQTQMDSGLDPATQSNKISHFFSPAYFQLGPGMLWKKSDNLKVNIAPTTSRLIVVHSHFTTPAALALSGNTTSFGVDQGKTTRYEFGAAVNGYYKFNVMKNVSVENLANFYSNYLDSPKNVDIDYQVNVVMTINKYLSTNFTFQTIYDDNAFQGFQTRQNIGLGVNYGF